MPQVPYSPIPQQAPQGAPTPYRTDAGVTPEAFGAGVGEARERFGQMVERSSSMLEQNVLQAQQLKNEADVNTATTDYIMKSGELINKFRELPGSQASDQLQDHVQQLRAMRESFRSSLNPMAQKMFDQETMHRFALDVVGSSQYAAQQMREYTKQSYEGKNDAIEQDTARRYRETGDPKVIDEGAKALKNNQVQAGTYSGEPTDVTNRKVRERFTSMIANISSAESNTNPDKARALFNEALQAGLIDEGKVEQIRNTLDVHEIQYYTRMDGAEIITNRIKSDPTGFSKDPEGFRIQMNKDAEAVAQKRFPDNPVRAQELADSLKHYVTTSANAEEKARNEETTEYKNRLGNIANTVGPNGRKPISMEEMLKIDPNAQNIYDETVRRDYKEALRMKAQWTANSKEDNILSVEQNLANDRWWAGKTNEDKMNVDAGKLFLAGKINKHTMDIMVSEQNKLTSLATNTDDVDKILGDYDSTLFNHGIYRSKGDLEANNMYDHFKGALKIMVADKQKELGRPVKAWTPQEEKNVVDRLILDTVKSGKKGLFGGDIMEPAYEHVYKTRFAPDMPAIVKQRAPDAKWDIGRQMWVTTINGRPIGVPTEPEKK